MDDQQKDSGQEKPPMEPSSVKMPLELLKWHALHDPAAAAELAERLAAERKEKTDAPLVLPDWLVAWRKKRDEAITPIKPPAEKPADDVEKKSGPPSPAIGELVPGEGVYIGTYTLRDDAGNSLNRIFNVFAAPEDLGKLNTYNKTVKRLSQMKDWHGHEGSHYPDAAALYADIRSGAYQGQWVIPPVELLDGLDAYGNRVQTDTLVAHKNAGALKGTFNTVAHTPSTMDYTTTCWYWSSTPARADSNRLMYAVHLGDDGRCRMGNNFMIWINCRPVRLTPVPAGDREGGKTALDMAMAAANPEIIKALIAPGASRPS